MSARGTPDSRHDAIFGTAASNSMAVRPVTNANRKNARNPHATNLADPTLRSAVSASTNSVTNAAVSPSRTASPPTASLAKNNRAT
ncbi:MAG: hypothetical protein R2755_26300 [Acidimicrobiales bacterium]